MRSSAGVVAAAVVAVASLAAQPPTSTSAPRLWTDQALAGWALPIAGVNATPAFYSEAEYYAAPVDELRTYPVYVKGREPSGYRDWIRRQGPQPLIDLSTLRSEAEWIAAGRDVFDSLHLQEFRTDDPRAFAWADDPDPASHGVSVAADGTIPGTRWLVDHDGRLKLTLAECSGCHSRLLPDGSVARGAQMNLSWGSLPPICFDQASAINRREGRSRPPNEAAYESYGVPWLKDDINARLKTMSAVEVERVDGGQPFVGTFVRFNASPWFTTRIIDLIGVKDRKYLDATATHRNRGPEDIARYAILVTVAEDGAIGPHTFIPERRRKLRWRNSDEALLALGRFIYSLQPPANPNRPNDLTARGEIVFRRSGCAACHTPPLYSNNKLVAVDGFTPFAHVSAPPTADVLPGIGLDRGLALRTRKGTGYYKVPSLKGVWYRGPLEHSGSIATLEEWFDPARLRGDYRSKGWNPPDTKTRAIPGHAFGLTLPAGDKQALIAFLRTL
jgi:hypothetical protein